MPFTVRHQTDINSLHMRHALFGAVKHGHTDICILLLKDYGMDPNSIINYGHSNLNATTIMLATIQYERYDVVKLLLECGASSYRIDGYISPLKKAVYINNYTICELLLDYGAHPTPLYTALFHGHTNICKLLISRGATTSKDVVDDVNNSTRSNLERYLANILRQMSE